jgi:4-hydroxybenzoate polyprenyltransferase
VKNLIVVLPILFARRFDSSAAWGRVGVAFAAFCLAASGVYILNDILDRHADREHPKKRNRPIAAGWLTVPVAVAESLLLAAAAVLLGGLVSWFFAGFVVAYLLLQLAYTFSLKHHALTDVIVLSLGFVLRAAGGAAALGVAISPWLIVCTFSLCLFLGFCKRAGELATIPDADTRSQFRRTLGCYTIDLLTHLLTLSAAIAIVSYLLYATSDRTVAVFGTNGFLYTLPLVFYGICRFAMLTLRGRYADPTEIVLRDWPIQATAVLWLIAAAVVVLYGPAIQQWLGRSTP